MTSTSICLYRSVLRVLLGLALASGTAGAAALPPPPPEAAALVRQPARGAQDYAVLPGASLAAYRRVLVAPVPVSFTATWAKEHPELKPREIEELRQDTAKLAREEIQRGLSRKGGLAVAQAPGEDVLEVRATILDLDIYAPEIKDAAIRQEYVLRAGEGSFVAELRDSRSGTLLARMADHRQMRDYPELQLANSVTNSADERDLIDAWTRILRRQLDTSRADRKGS